MNKMKTFKKEHKQWHNDNAGKYPTAKDYHKALRKHFKDWQLVEKPVIPQNIADWVENFSVNHYGTNLQTLSKYMDSTEVKNWLQKEQGNDIKLIRAVIDGYEVEKPKDKKYKVKFGTLWLLKTKLHGCEWDRVAKESATTFTKQELAEIADGAVYKQSEVLPFELLDYISYPKSKYCWEFNEELDLWEWINSLIELEEVDE